MNRARIAGISVFMAVSLFIVLAKPFPLLSPAGHHVAGVCLAALALWVFKSGATPYLLGSAILVAGCLLGGQPLGTVASGYAGPALWVLIPSLFFGFALAKTGLGTRIAYFVLKAFEPGWGAVTLSWCIIGLLLSALTPSITVRLSILMPIAASTSAACGLKARSKGSSLICLVAWASAILPGTAWQTGSLWGIIMMGFYPPSMRCLVSPGVWFEYMAVPWMVITLVFLLLVYLFFKPREAFGLTRRHFQERYEALGPISGKEIICGLILLTALVLFSAEKWTGVRTQATALAALAALMISGVIEAPEVSSGVNWDIINFFAVVTGLPAIFAEAGVSGWAGSVVQPWLFAFAESPLVFLILLTLSLWVVRFIDIPWGYTAIALLSPAFVPLHETFGLHPALVSVALIAAGNSFFLPYQQPFMVIGSSMTEGKAWSAAHAGLAGLLYGVAVVTGLLVSSFYWKGMGLMP